MRYVDTTKSHKLDAWMTSNAQRPICARHLSQDR